MLYVVKWEIDLEADSPEEAARLALAIHRKPDSIATVFDVAQNRNGDVDEWTRVDLSEIDGEDDL